MKNLAHERTASTRLAAAWLVCGVVLVSGAAIAQTANRQERRNELISAKDSEEEIARTEDDAREERDALDALDEVVDVKDLERKRKAQSLRNSSNSDVDFVTITRHKTRTGTDSISLQVASYNPQGEIRFRASDARQLAEGANSRLKLQRDRLTTNGSPIRSATLEFTAGLDEADGLPAVIRINARTSLFNFDYARLDNSTRPLMALLKNAMDPESLICESELRLGAGAADFHDRFILLGNGFGDCNRTVKSQEEGLVFADAVPQRLRQELRAFHDPISKQLSRNPGSEPGIVFVIWRPESPRNDFRFVRSLNRTGVLLLNGPSWEQGFSAQQSEALQDAIALSYGK